MIVRLDRPWLPAAAGLLDRSAAEPDTIDAPQPEGFTRCQGTDGVIVATGYVCGDWGGRTEPGQSCVDIAVPTDRPPHAIDVAVFDDLCSSVGGSARELWTCMREGPRVTHAKVQ